jgi:chromosome segregation ATPase
MLEANAKLRQHVDDLRSRKNDLISAEDAINGEIAASDAQLKGLLTQQREMQAATAATAADLQSTRQRLADVSAALSVEDRRRARLQESSADAALARDKLRSDQVHLREQVDSLKRQLLSQLRRTKDVNATVSRDA